MLNLQLKPWQPMLQNLLNVVQAAWSWVHRATYGLVVWRMTFKKVGSQKVFISRGPEEAEPWFFVPIVDYKQLRVSKVEAMPPVAMARRVQDPGLRDAVAMVKGDMVDPVVAAARSGFRQMALAVMGKLVVELKMVFTGGKKPKLEQDMVQSLCWAVIPNCTDEDVRAALVARKVKYHGLCDSLLVSPANLEKIEHGFEEDDFHIKEPATKAYKEKTATQVVTEAAPRLRRATPAERADGWALGPLLESGWTLATARALMPDVRGALLGQDTRRFARWSAKYPKQAPCNVSKSWGPRTGSTIHSSLCFVLHQVWRWHHDATGDVIPWDFAAGMPDPAAQFEVP